jgi:decaprenylphospho-beta-D-ribofuranose 2-oxidase
LIQLASPRRTLYFLALAVGFSLAALLQASSQSIESSRVLNDASRLNRTVVHEVASGSDSERIRQAVVRASTNNLKISISGKRHSMGGHTLYPNAVVLDMLAYNKIISLDSAKRIVTVQSGATWKDLQDFLNQHGLAVIAMQGPNIFTIGGTLSVNAHGWDLHHGPVAETAEWFTLMLADGSIRKCSRSENSELFHLALGGYGLFGVILDVGLRVTSNDVYVPTDLTMDYTKYPEYFDRNVLSNPDIDLGYADLSISPSSLLTELVAVTYVKRQGVPASTIPPQEEKHVSRDKFLIDLSRKFSWGKRLRWYLQIHFKDQSYDGSMMTRNNIMRSPARRLEYHSQDDTDILQEYFIPKHNFVQFADGLREIVGKYDANLLNVTIRHVKPNQDAFLNYAKTEALAFVLYFNVPTSSAGQATTAQWTRELINLATDLGGTFYLPYLPYYNKAQLKRAYPEIETFFQKKKEYDPKELFMNSFYAKYSQ